MSFIDTRLKIRRFFRKYKRIIVFVIIGWSIIFIINYVLKNMPKKAVPQTTYEPNVSVMADDEVPKKWQDTIKSTIDTFVQKCNNKEYESAYDMISDDCKEALYPKLDNFKDYVDTKYSRKRAYSIQNFSNVGKQYIYDVNIMDDLMATGLTGKDYSYIEEKFVFTENDNSLKLAIGGFVRKNDLNVVGEDENLKIQIPKKYVYYDSETYEVTIKNKTDHPIVLADGTTSNEVSLNIGNGGNRNEKSVGTYKIVLKPNEIKSYKFTFSKYCDDGNAPKYITFNSIRVLNSYSGDDSTKQAELDNAVRLYSLRINFNTK